ncbi:hypothetical protein [Ferdinandcohnia sp. Marseille-Q9671]
MEKNEHLKNQVLYITNPAYDALHAESNEETNHDGAQEEKALEQMSQTDVDK